MPSSRSAIASWILAPALLAAAVSAPPEPAGESVTLTGKVVELSELVKALGPTFDLDPVARQVVLVDDAGVATPLLSDDASRALFKDERLRNRRTQVVGRRVPGLPYLRVLLFKIEDEGRLRTPEYYCEICTISVRFPQICPCCQGAMELRMAPER